MGARHFKIYIGQNSICRWTATKTDVEIPHFLFLGRVTNMTIQLCFGSNIRDPELPRLLNNGRCNSNPSCCDGQDKLSLSDPTHEKKVWIKPMHSITCHRLDGRETPQNSHWTKLHLSMDCNKNGFGNSTLFILGACHKHDNSVMLWQQHQGP